MKTAAKPAGADRTRRPLDWLFVRLPHLAMAIVLLAGVIINFTNVVLRYGFNSPIFWAEEVLVFLTIWGVCLGLVAITYRGEHLNMDLFSAKFGAKTTRVVNTILVVTFLAALSVAAWQSFKVVSFLIQTGQVSIAAEVPKSIPNAAFLFGFVLAGLAVILRVRSYMANKF